MGLEITSNEKTISIKTNEYSLIIGYIEKNRLKSTITSFTKYDNYIDYMVSEGGILRFHFENNDNNAFVINSVNGISPTSLSHLFELLKDLI